MWVHIFCLSSHHRFYCTAVHCQLIRSWPSRDYMYRLGQKKVARSFVIHTVHEQWSVRRHDCVISDTKLIMKTFLLELEPVWLVYLLYINLLVTASCIKPFSNICNVDNFCVLISQMGYFLLTHPVLLRLSCWVSKSFRLLPQI